MYFSCVWYETDEIGQEFQLFVEALPYTLLQGEMKISDQGKLLASVFRPGTSFSLRPLHHRTPKVALLNR